LPRSVAASLRLLQEFLQPDENLLLLLELVEIGLQLLDVCADHVVALLTVDDAIRCCQI
jgi:hypothetical protein